MSSYLDIHCHALHPDFPRAIVNLSPASAFDILDNSTHPFFSCGIHPWDAHSVTEQDISQLRELASNQRIVAIGECGLDKNAQATSERQSELFLLQLQLAEIVRKPILVHLNGLYPLFFNIIRQFKPTQACIIHGFRGKPELAKQLLQAGVYLSFGSKFNPQAVAITPLQRLCVETDCAPDTIESNYTKIALLKNCKTGDIQAPDKIFKQVSNFNRSNF